MAVNLRIAGAAGLVVFGVVAAGVVGQLPAFGVTDSAMVATPSSAAQSLVCPGPAIAVGADSANASALTATGRPTRVAGTVGGTAPTSTALDRGDVKGGTAPRVLSAPAAAKAGAIAGAQVEQVTTGDAAGLAATACTAPRSDLWFAAGATTTGRTTVLTLANASAVPAQVRVRVWSEQGPVDAASISDLVVPAEGRRAVSLAGVAPSAGGVVVRVTSSGGLVGAALEQRTVRGLESGGVDLVGPTAAPTTAQVVPGVRVAGAAAVATAARADDSADLATVVRVLVPGRVAADVTITATPDAGGQAVTVGRRVAAGVVTDFPVPGLADGTYTVRVAADRPLVTGVRTSVVGDAGASSTPDDSAAGAPTTTGAGAAVGTDAGLVGGDGPADTSSSAAAGAASVGTTSTARGIDLAWFAAAPTLTGTASVAVVDAPAPVLTIAGTGRARSVTLSGATPATVQVPAKGSVAVPVAKGLLVLRGADGLFAAVSYAGADAVAGYPVGAADQEARGIRVFR
ncbi:DUF5719 family protein [uncultured Amnibacterium sp.]|uniref:DUF5719 family protein n=1 Tax=uncultured Amnibacterium sp. TaxID=1631851 RepID=UPI0035CB1FE2